VRRLLALALGAVLVVGTAGPALAQSVTPSGKRLESPREAASGTPIWVRSISPCPPKSAPQVHRYVEAWITPQAGSLRGDLIEVLGHVDSKGDWEVTLMAPNGTGAGATAPYYVRAACLEDDPWAAAPLDEDPGVKPVAVEYYEPNLLWVTSSGGGGPDGPPADWIPDPDRYEIVPTTEPPRETTTTTQATTTSAPTTTAPTTTTEATVAAAGLGTLSATDAEARLAAVRRELALHQAQRDDVTLSVFATSATRPVVEPVDAGVPLWAFVLATMLAVGAVIGYGARRTTDPER